MRSNLVNLVTVVGDKSLIQYLGSKIVLITDLFKQDFFKG